MLINAAPESITLVNRSECDMALGIVRELPHDDRPYGENYMFFSATSTHLPPHAAVNTLGRSLHRAIFRPGQTPEGVPKFEPVELDKDQGAALAAASFLIARLSPPQGMSSLVVEAAQESIDAARLMSTLLLHAGVTCGVNPTRAQHVKREIGRRNRWYLSSVSAAAGRLLEKVHDECSWVVDNTPEVVLGGQPRGQALKSALSAYRMSNSVLLSFTRGEVRV